MITLHFFGIIFLANLVFGLLTKLHRLMYCIGGVILLNLVNLFYFQPDMLYEPVFVEAVLIFMVLLISTSLCIYLAVESLLKKGDSKLMSDINKSFIKKLKKFQGECVTICFIGTRKHHETVMGNIIRVNDKVGEISLDMIGKDIYIDVKDIMHVRNLDGALFSDGVYIKHPKRN